MRGTRCVADAMASKSSRLICPSAIAGPSRSRNIASSSQAAATSQHGAQRPNTRTGFGMKKSLRNNGSHDDADFGFGMTKTSGPRSTARGEGGRTPNQKGGRRPPRPLPVPDIPTIAAAPGTVEEADSINLKAPRLNLKQREFSDLNWIQVHFSRSTNASTSPSGASSSTASSSASGLYHPDLLAFAWTFASPDKIYFLDAHIHPLATALTIPRALLADMTPEEEGKTAKLLGMLWVRANELKRANQLASLPASGKRPSKRTEKEKWSANREVPSVTAAKCLSRFLVARATRHEDTVSGSEALSHGDRARILLQHLESAMEVYRERTKQFLLPASVFAAWAILRQEAGVPIDTRPEKVLRLVPPPMTKLQPVLEELEGLSNAGGELVSGTKGRYAEALQGLIDLTAGDRSLSTTIEELDAALADSRIKRENERGVALWDQWRAAAESPTSATPSQSDILNSEPSTRTAVLLSFFRFFARNPRQRKQTSEEARLATQRDQVLAMFPKPWSSDVHHAVLRFHAKMDEGDLPTVSEVRALEEEAATDALAEQAGVAGSGMSGRLEQNREERLRDLKAAWAAAEKDKAVDMKLYMLYVEGLGKLGDAQGIKDVWTRLGKDERVKEQFKKTEGGKATFPPTSALNHIISSALLIRDSGPPVALELLHEAASPDSVTKCNVITINTILRHYASTRNVDGLTATIGMAEKLHLSPDVITYTTLLQGLLRSDQIDLAKRTLANMSEQGIQPNEHTAGLLISDLVRKGDRNGLLAAEDLMKEMKRMGMMVGVVPWTSLIGGYYRGGWLADAKQALARMKGQRVELNRVGYNMLLREAGRIASRPPSTSIPHSRWMRPNANQSAIRDMLDQNAQRSADLAQQVYQDSTRRMADTMLVLFQEMDKAQPRVEANADTYTIMLQALVQHQRMEEADWVLGKMREHGYTPEKATLRTWVRRVEGWQGERRRKEAAVAKGYSV